MLYQPSTLHTSQQLSTRRETTARTQKGFYTSTLLHKLHFQTQPFFFSKREKQNR